MHGIERTPGAVKKYPEKLENLLYDTRYLTPQRYLRKLYRDPISNRAEWGLVMAPEGGIMGVHSLSNAAPIKITGFTLANSAFENSAKYSDWVFSYTPPVSAPQANRP